jgi:phenylalanyl-tRNA synthetase beta chain
MTAPRRSARGGLFDAAAIRKSARSQGLRTEASARYERGVNPAELGWPAIAPSSCCKSGGATVVAQTTGTTALGVALPERVITLRLSRVTQLLGKSSTWATSPKTCRLRPSKSCWKPWAAR